ncbi:MAG: selenide, water dikinase SelD [Rhodospirillaceae bacterium]|nr:selenide, water dikinase SelD [Rhodospirillaceae bacterium]
MIAGDDGTASKPVRLTSLSHGGGCGCKIAPDVLQKILVGVPASSPFQNLLVGTESSDDAAVWQIDDATCIVATTDFFMPMVDDPHDFGRIAATNAISDVYAMGGRPIMALAILGIPVGKIDLEDVRAIVAGGAAVCESAGMPVAGGHSIDSPELVYGLAVIGTCAPQNVRRNRDAQIGDVLILTKPLGVGIYSAAIKKGALGPGAYAELIETTTQLNRIGTDLGSDPSVHAMTDVTGFGLLGHALEMARGAGLRIVIDADELPLMTLAMDLAQYGMVTGASHRNWSAYEHAVALPRGFSDVRRHLLTDPQTSGGLLIACASDRAPALLASVRAAGFNAATIIGRVVSGAPCVEIRA